jgi:hypothetical protein
MFFGSAYLGLVLFVFGLGSVFVEAFDLKAKLMKPGFPAVHAASTAAVLQFRTRELLGALAGRAWQGRAARTKASRAKQDS